MRLKLELLALVRDRPARESESRALQVGLARRPRGPRRPDGNAPDGRRVSLGFEYQLEGEACTMWASVCG